jgi:hypothetical protein
MTDAVRVKYKQDYLLCNYVTPYCVSIYYKVHLFDDETLKLVKFQFLSNTNNEIN